MFYAQSDVGSACSTGQAHQHCEEFEINKYWCHIWGYRGSAPLAASADPDDVRVCGFQMLVWQFSQKLSSREHGQY